MNHVVTSLDAGRILVVDDQDDNVALLDAILDARGFEVLPAYDGPTGLSIAAESHPDLILLDLAMPGMDGFEVLERLRRNPRTARIPVIILTANRKEAAMVARGLELGASEYLTKPIQMDELVVRIRNTLRLAAAERALEKLRRDFASMLVHDMRAPLDGIRLTLGVLRRQEDESSPRHAMLQNALTAVEEVASLVDDLLESNRLEEEGFTPDTQPVDLALLVKRSLGVLRPLATSRGIALSAAVPTELPLVSADPALLKRVVDNLLSNALKFTQEGAVQVAVQRRDGLLLVEVHDTGPGIPEAMKSQIFGRYAQVVRASGERREGYGLGLAFCDRAVRAMGGAIAVRDAAGGGSVFSFELPVAEAQ
ncbi:MAG: hybrid sensor histidine kinase/response regulator [Candidatus Sericytochromatia bacterium]|nr:hybrid sensor histidine kinase/response regulator [Candidatus Sericytochromatia bacterium]